MQPLREHRVEQNLLRLKAESAWEDDDFVFATQGGTPVDPANFRKHHLAIRRRLDLGPWRSHALRHPWATLALEAGVPLEVLSKHLGHASLAITADVCVKVPDRAERRAAYFVDSA